MMVMAMNRTYQSVIADLEALGITFTGRGRWRTRSAFASAARSWGDRRYRKELNRLARAQRRREQYQQARDAGISATLARTVSGFGEARFARFIDSVVADGDPNALNNYIENKMSREPGTIPSDLWTYYARIENYPTDIEIDAYTINRLAGYGENDNYGWAFVYYVYVMGASPNDVLAYLDVSPFDGNAYRELLSAQGLI